jgi:L-threonylcarbamoyladenylate synthase
MKILPPDSTGIAEALIVLKNGGVVAHATETCYGLACDMKNEKAIAQLFAIKQRPGNQPVSALFSSVAEAKKYVEWNDEAEKLAQQYLPGPLTLILPMKNPLHATPTTYNLQTLGIRISSHPLAMTLAEKFGSPISTTSANIHGQPNPYSIEDMTAQFSGKEFVPDLILDSGKLPPTPPSTIVDLTQPGGGIVRAGTLILP